MAGTPGSLLIRHCRRVNSRFAFWSEGHHDTRFSHLIEEAQSRTSAATMIPHRRSGAQFSRSCFHRRSGASIDNKIQRGEFNENSDIHNGLNRSNCPFSRKLVRFPPIYANPGHVTGQRPMLGQQTPEGYDKSHGSCLTVPGWEPNMVGRLFCAALPGRSERNSSPHGTCWPSSREICAHSGNRCLVDHRRA